MSITEIPPKIIKPLDKTTEVRQDLTVTLKVQTDKPAEGVWYKDGKPVENDENVEVSVNGNFQRLHITRATVADAGEYVCKIGEHETKGVLTIKGRSKVIRCLGHG